MKNMIFIQGLIIGLAMTAPIGPVTVLCIGRTLKKGIWSGILSGLGSATAYGLGGIIAIMSLSLCGHCLKELQKVLHFSGGFFLIIFGGMVVACPPRFFVPKSKSFGYFKDFYSTFLLTISNPLTFLALYGVFIAFGLMKYYSTYDMQTFFPIGVFVGSAVWWLLLVEGMSLFRNQITVRLIQMINKVMGICFFIFGFFMIFSFHY